MLGPNFEKSSRSKNKEQNYIKEEIEKHQHPENRHDFDSSVAGTDKLSENSVRSIGFYDEKNRLDVQEEIKNVMAMHPGPEKNKAFSELKESFLWQQKGLAVLKNELFKEIGFGDDINLEKINEIINENDKIYNFSWRQMSVIKNMTKDFLRKNQAVNNFYDDNFQSPNKIYQKLYNVEPTGKVELRKGPISLALICDNKDDYIHMYACSSGGDLGSKEKKDCDASAGFFSPSYSGGFPELRGTIIGVKRMYDFYTKETIEHEEQHAVNRVYLNNIIPLQKEGLSSFLHYCNNKEQMKDIISSYCHYLIYDASNLVKDEIIAYKTGDQSDKFIIQTLIRSEKTGGIYDYFDLDKTMKSIERICENGVLKQYQDELLNLAEKILKDEYESLIKAGVNAVNILKNKNYSQASIAAVLMPQALENWLKAAERAKFSDDYSKSQNELQNVAYDDEVKDLEDLRRNLPAR